MKLHATLSGHRADVEVRREDAGVIASVDDRRYELTIHEFAPNRFFLMSQGQVFNCRVEGRAESGPVDVFVGTERFSVTLTDPKRLRGSSNESAHGDEAAQILASMPGKVVRLLVEVGAQVQAGEGVVTVEAMKMQNEMKSPKAGTVVALNVQTGATVNAGEVLAIIE
jgi:biotin carboxyl carrier protein